MSISGVIQEKKNHILKLKPDPKIQEQNETKQSSAHKTEPLVILVTAVFRILDPHLIPYKTTTLTDRMLINFFKVNYAIGNFQLKVSVS